MARSNIYLRLATMEDTKQLFQWRNEVSVRDNSFQSELILYEEHRAWIEKTLQNTNVQIYILMVEGKAVGQVRIDFKEDVGIVNYSIDSQYRRRGYGKKILQLLENELLTLDIKLIGDVKKNNVASQKIFKKLGYGYEEKKDRFRYIKSMGKFI